MPFVLQMSVPPQPPQKMLFPQPVMMVPHWTPAVAQSIGAPIGAHWLFVPPAPHAEPAGHPPQLRSPPQPSDATPQLSPSCAHVFLLQFVQTCDTWSQTWPPVHV